MKTEGFQFQVSFRKKNDELKGRIVGEVTRSR